MTNNNNNTTKVKNMITVRYIATLETVFTFRNWNDFYASFPNGLPTDGKKIFEVVEN
jgi:hypothetical protein